MIYVKKQRNKWKLWIGFWILKDSKLEYIYARYKLLSMDSLFHKNYHYASANYCISSSLVLSPEAWRRSCSRVTISSVFSCVAERTTDGAFPSTNASFHLPAHRHQQSSGFKPGNPYIGYGVERSLPLDFEKFKKVWSTLTHTVCFPSSSGPVWQNPSYSIQ